MERALSCHAHTHTHSLTHTHTQTTPSVTLPVTSDCWWRWHVFKRRTSRVREEESLEFFFSPLAVGRVVISDALSTSCSLGSALAFCELHKHASTATWGLGGGSRWTDTSGGFREGENPVARQVVHAGVHNVFHELLVPHVSHSGGRVEAKEVGYWDLIL